MVTTSDAIFEALFVLLRDDPARPQTLKVEPFPVLELDREELPYLGMRLTDGERPTDEGPSSGGSSERSCRVAFEVWCAGDNPLQATASVRLWLLKTLAADETLGGLVFRTEFNGYQAEPLWAEGWVGMAVLDFTFVYDWRPE